VGIKVNTKQERKQEESRQGSLQNNLTHERKRLKDRISAVIGKGNVAGRKIPTAELRLGEGGVINSVRQTSNMNSENPNK